MRLSRALLATTLLLALLAQVRIARADDQAELDKVRAAYLKHEYDDAGARLRAMLDPKSRASHDPALLTQAEMYWGAVQLGKGDADGASKSFAKLILEDMSYEPDSLSFPTDVIDLFIDTRTRLRTELNEQAEERARKLAEQRAREAEEKKRAAARLVLLEKLASEETTTERHSRWIAFVPFGAGQFQNGDRALGWAFLGVEAGLLAGTLVTLPVYLTDLQYRNDAYAQGDTVRASEYVDRANDVRTVNLSLAGAFAAVAVAGVIEAHVAYVPDRIVVKKRDVPAVSWGPMLAPERGGGFAGIEGRF